MDTEFAKTFLAVVDTGSFVKAAERVHLTQSTVSMRIKTLEDQIGRPLFIRTSGGVTLTPEGVKFQTYASVLVRTWDQARMDLKLSESYKRMVRIGSQYSIWDDLLLTWLSEVREEHSEAALKSLVGVPDVIMNWLLEGNIDLAIMYRPDRFPGLTVEPLFDDRIVLVTSAENPDHLDPKDYIYVDWGPQFRIDHDAGLPGLSSPGLSMDVGPLALKFVTMTGAYGYFPERMVKDLLNTGRLRLVRNSPVFTYPVYLVWLAGQESAEQNLLIESLRQFVANRFAPEQDFQA